MVPPAPSLGMLCATCRRSLQARLPLFRNHLPLPLLTRRSIATAPATPNAAPTHPPPPSATSSNPPASSTTSSGGTPSPPSSTSTPTNTTPTGTGGSKTRVKEKVRSSVAGGAVLQGLGYTKAKPQILAKEDEEYPTWLWGILDEDAAVAGEGAIAPTRKQRIKATRKQSKLSKDITPSIPIHEQSKDLTVDGDDAVVSLERRSEIIRSSRVARRKDIRENNFLRGL